MKQEPAVRRADCGSGKLREWGEIQENGATMRTFHRPLVICSTCGAKIHNGSVWSEKFGEDVVQARWTEPPNETEECPRCRTNVSTSAAYPCISGFPPTFESLRRAYEGFAPKQEWTRQSFERTVEKFLSEAGIADCEVTLNSAEGFGWYKQRMFYRSATAFYRSLQLFLAYLTLEKHCYRSWADVTAYYSRFYFIQAFLNLGLSTFLNVKKHKVFIFFDGAKVKCIEQQSLPKLFERKGPHDMW